MYCYAFVIADNGNYQVLKYGANTSSRYATLTQGTLSAIHGQNQFNILQVVVQGSHFSFKVNGISPVVIIHQDGYDPGQSTSTPTATPVITHQDAYDPGNTTPTPTATPITVTDSSYIGGQPALMVAGPNTSFTVTSVKVSSP